MEKHRKITSILLLAACGMISMLSGCDCESTQKVADEATGVAAVERFEKQKEVIKDIESKHNEQLNKVLEQNK